jgi:arylsulfatase A-like enzyme
MNQALNFSRRRLLGAGAAMLVRPATAATRPNILMITTDQQFGDAMSCRIGNRYLKTPHMDSLAASGMLFERAYCANPICVPSRTSLFTGRYPVETNVEVNDTSPIDAARFPCIGAQLRKAGYATGYFGKWHLPFAQGKNQIHGFEVLKWDKERGDAATKENASAFIRAKRGGPFFAVASFLNPHNICEWARGQELSEGDVGAPPPSEQCPPRRANFAAQKDEPDIVATMRESYQATPMFPVGMFDEDKWRQYLWAYYRLIEKADAHIGGVLQTLRDAGLEKDTLVIFSADHGDCQGAHGWNQKTILFEEATRVPFILSWKGTTRPGTSTRLVNTGIDLWPTLADYAGIGTGDGYPGLSLKATANGAIEKELREYVVVSDELAQGAPVKGKELSPHGRMVRSQRYKYCVYSEGEHRESLVDLEKDPGEMTNLVHDVKFSAVRTQHRDWLAKWCRQYRDSFPVVT